MKRRISIAILVPVVSLGVAACGSAGGGSESASPSVVKACSDLKAGDWASLMDSSQGDGLYDVAVAGPTPRMPPTGGGFPDRLSNSANYGKSSAYAGSLGNTSGDWQPNNFALGWTRDDALQEGKNTFDSAWQTCAANDPDFPSAVDSALEETIMQGAAVYYRRPG